MPKINVKELIKKYGPENIIFKNRMDIEPILKLDVNADHQRHEVHPLQCSVDLGIETPYIRASVLNIFREREVEPTTSK